VTSRPPRSIRPVSGFLAPARSPCSCPKRC
jgi:hypothetical protein